MTCRFGVGSCKGDFLDLVGKVRGEVEKRREAGRRRKLREICDECATHHRAIGAAEQGSRRASEGSNRDRG